MRGKKELANAPRLCKTNPMKIADYMRLRELNSGQMAALVGVKRQSIERYASGRVPCAQVMLAIIRATHGKVMPDDFFLLH